MAELTEGRAVLPGGVWRHKESGAEMLATETEKFGNPQADAYFRMGFEYVGPAKGADKEALAAIPDPHAAPLVSPAGMKTVSDLEAELADAKEREATFEARKAEADKVNAVAEKQMADSNPASATDTKSSSKKESK